MLPSVFDFASQFEHNRSALLNELVRGIEEALVPFQIALDGFLAGLSRDALPSNWREEWEAFVIEQQTQGFTVDPTSVEEMKTWIESWAKEFDLWPEAGERPSAAPAQVDFLYRTANISFASTEDPPKSDSHRVKAILLSQKKSPSQKLGPPTVPPPANAGGLNSRDYNSATQAILRLLGSDWKNVAVNVMTRLRDTRHAIFETTGAVLGNGANALGVDAFVRLERNDGAIDTAHFRFKQPFFSSPHWTFVALARGKAPVEEAAKVSERQKIRHEDVMRVRGGINRIQGGMFAIVGGVGGIVEGGVLLGTLEAMAGAEQVALGGADIATGKENREWSKRVFQAALEGAGVDPETARFLADHGGLVAALSRATVEVGSTARTVIETSSGYRIRLEFDPTTLSSNGLGGVKVKAIRLAPDGTEIKQVGGRYPINSKYAGKVMPASELPENLRKKYPNGVRFTSDGYPDLSPYSIKTVKPKTRLTGNYKMDEAIANKEAGLKQTPTEYTWHHHEDGVTMQLVPSDLHWAAKHTGGSAVIRAGGP